MTNLKKTLAVVLAFAMMLSMGSVFAFSDVEAGTTVSEAVGILTNLDIIEGFEDGTFRPDETVTRAQMAAIICRMLGYEDQAKSSMGSTVFTDVDADHWASGYVNVAQAQGIINGMGDGTFAPDAKVTYEQAIKMIVASLGYDLAAARKGGYPTGYLAIASAEGITKKANGKVGDAAARATIAVLVYNALEVQLMDQDSWSSDGDDRYSQTDDTVLSKYLGVSKYEGVVANTPVTSVAAEGSYDSTATPKFSLANGAFYWDYQDDKLVKVTHNPGAVICDKVDVNAFLGKSVIAYIGEDDLTGKDTVFAIAASETKNDSFKISATQLVKSGEKYWDVADTVGYKKVGSSKILDLTLDDNATVYVNYVVDTAIDTTTEIATATRNGGTVEFISNDADSDYEVVVITAYDDEAVVEKVDEIDGTYKFTLYKGTRPSRIDVEDEDALAIVYKDGEAATVADIAANDTVSYVQVARDFDIYFVSSATVTGTVDSYDSENDIVTIAGEDYEVSKKSGLTVAKLSGEEGTFFLNVDGQIAYNETAPTAAGNYALVLASYVAASGVDSGDYLQVVLTDGTLAEYKIGQNAKVYTADGEVESSDVKAYFDAKLNGIKSGSDAKFATVADVTSDKDLMVKLTIGGDKITKVRLLEGTSRTAAATDKFDAEAMSIGRVDIDADTVIFSVKESASADVIEAEDIVIGTAADFFVDDEEIGGALRAYDMDDNSSIFAAAVGFGLTKAIDATSNLFVVTGKKTTTIDDNDAYVFTGVQAGEEVQVTVYNEDGYTYSDPATVAIGDILLLAEANADGIVSEIDMLLDYSTKTSYASDAKADDDIYSGFGKVTLSARNKFAIENAIKNDTDASTEFAAEEELSYRAAATYTLLDYTENAKNPEVSIESGSEWLFDTVEFESYAYVRYVDGRMAEVIVYRVAEVADIEA